VFAADPEGWINPVLEVATRRDEDARTESGTRRTDGIPARRLLPEVRTVVQEGVLDNFLENFALEPFRDRKRGVA